MGVHPLSLIDMNPPDSQPTPQSAVTTDTLCQTALLQGDPLLLLMSLQPQPWFADGSLQIHLTLLFSMYVETTWYPFAKMTTSPAAFSKLKGLKIGHYNIRSVHYKFSELYELVKNFDILCISESWLTEGYSDHKLYIPGYIFYRQDRVIDKNGGSILLNCTGTDSLNSRHWVPSY